MSELDRLREQLVYLRFWLGIMVATEIALVGWLIGRSSAASIELVNCSHGASPRNPSPRRRGALRRHRA
jgi:hypothetical protein